MFNRFQKKIFILFQISITLFLTGCFSSDTSTEIGVNDTIISDIDVDDEFLNSIISYTEDATFETKEYPLIDPETIQIDSLFVQVAYALSEKRWIIIGRSVNDDPTGLKLLLIDPLKDNKLLFQTKGAYQSLILHPTFFISSLPYDPTIILCAIGISASWGQVIYLMKNDTIKELGYMDVVMKEAVDSTIFENHYLLKDISPYTSINKTNNGVHFTFKADSILYYGSKGDIIDPTLSGQAIKYTFYNGVLRLEWQE
jgi:hypothetical protein